MAKPDSTIRYFLRGFVIKYWRIRTGEGGREKKKIGKEENKTLSWFGSSHISSCSNWDPFMIYGPRVTHRKRSSELGFSANIWCRVSGILYKEISDCSWLCNNFQNFHHIISNFTHQIIILLMPLLCLSRLAYNFAICDFNTCCNNHQLIAKSIDQLERLLFQSASPLWKCSKTRTYPGLQN